MSCSAAFTTGPGGSSGHLTNRAINKERERQEVKYKEDSYHDIDSKSFINRSFNA